MASILKRTNPSGKVVYRVQFKDQHGKRHEITAGPLKKHAEALLSTVLEQVNAGTYGVDFERLTFPELCEQFLVNKKSSVKSLTWEDYERNIRNHLVPLFGDILITEIRPSDVQKMIPYLEGKGLSSASAGKALRYLKAILRYAYSLDLINSDPTKPIRAPRIVRQEVDFLSPKETRDLLKAADEDMRAILATACYAGLRQGEILALRWKDVDFDEHRIRVVRTYHYSHGFSEPKTKSSRRAVPIPSTLVSILENYCALRGEHDPDSLVFVNQSGKPIDRRNLVRRNFNKTLKAAALRHIRFHDLRHTYASLAIASGMDPKALQQAMGHSSIRITLDIYGHLYPGSYDNALQKLEALISDKKGSSSA